MTNVKESKVGLLPQILLGKLSEGFEGYLRGIVREEIAKRKIERQQIVENPPFEKKVKRVPIVAQSAEKKKVVYKKAKKRRRVNDDDIGKMRILFSRGYTNSAISKVLGFSNTTIREWREKVAYNIVKVSSDDSDKMGTDRSLGVPMDEISRLYGVSKATIYKKTKED